LLPFVGVMLERQGKDGFPGQEAEGPTARGFYVQPAQFPA
jgi:hypothetical protein